MTNRFPAGPDRLPAAARAIVAAATAACDAAAAEAVEAFDPAVARLASAEPEQVRLVLGLVVRALLEDLHPDGVSSQDLLEEIKSCARTSIGWYPQIDVQVLVVVLTGALGLHEPDEEPRRFSPLDVARHAPLFIAELLHHRAQRHQPARPLADYLADAFAERARAELTELP